MSHPYKCYSEILTQRAAWQEAVEVVLSHEPTIRSFFKDLQPTQIIFAGCTSPYYAGKSAAPYWQSILNIPVTAAPCSELIQFPETYYLKENKPLLVVLSRSGKTSETIWAVEQFTKRFPGQMIYIGNAPDSVLAQMAGLNILIPKGAEETLPQTRSFSSMYLAAQMMAALIGDQKETLNILVNSPQAIDSIIQVNEPTIQHINERQNYQNIFYLGSGPLHGIALEATLKMIEMSFSNALCFPVLEARHGPKSLIDENSLVIALYSHAGQNYEVKLMEELTRVHHATTVAIIPDLKCNPGKVSYSLTANCNWPDAIQGLSYMPLVQLLAYYQAVQKDVNPDTPINLTAFIKIQPS